MTRTGPDYLSLTRKPFSVDTPPIKSLFPKSSARTSHHNLNLDARRPGFFITGLPYFRNCFAWINQAVHEIIPILQFQCLPLAICGAIQSFLRWAARLAVIGAILIRATYRYPRDLPFAANESDSFTLQCTNAIDFWAVAFGNDEITITPQFENTKLADALAEILVYLLENNLIEAPQ